mmetsp:Transcript_12307/g.19074  ORF Transcript_12307/g.19074 Transcript_12307/m.19074 type:complete len:1059 (-) Transcript_12307:131-3307(-)|eukprot:CAMPEP_0195300744 /NCGR_PEP_ID=MMETSP0707-20130614/28058_1 /TAXON_ID=33640 /ORGANISM="Asterionellopsis glacialis, Strain CCMP134" /LENGTH=1058 /DNA_ID=CAMNT_0040363523 /DNA_START=114 /DNA_END=3290 /DNA_ORIENTATION=+
MDASEQPTADTSTEKSTTATQQRPKKAMLSSSWLDQMSIEDKIGQMSQIDLSLILRPKEFAGVSPTQGEVEDLVDPAMLEYYFGILGVGSVLNCPPESVWTAAQYRSVVVQIQNVTDTYNRPPVIWGLDSIHGANYVHGSVLTPQPLNIAASFNSSIAYMAGQLASRDTRAAGITWLFSPLLGIAMEPKWSRVYETFGEDPYVVGQMASSMISGIQALPESSSGQKESPPRAAACAKHFVGYSNPHNGHDRSPSWIPTRHLYQYFVPPWRDGLLMNTKRDTNDDTNDGPARKSRSSSIPLTVMESYTEIDGVPNVANYKTTQLLLRDQLKFKGVMVTDYQEILNLKNWHHIVNTPTEAVTHALREGSVDMSMIPLKPVEDFLQSVITALQEQDITEQRVHESARRVLQLKETLGMLDLNYDIRVDEDIVHHVGKGRQDALDMAHQGFILTKNVENDIAFKNDGGGAEEGTISTSSRVLPLSKIHPMQIHVTGPTSNSLSYQSGGWTGRWQGVVPEDDNLDGSWFTYGSTVVQAIADTTTNWSVTVSCGVSILGNECADDVNEQGGDSSSADKMNSVSGVGKAVVGTIKAWIGMDGKDKDLTSIQRAAKEASHADVVIVCVGEEAYAEKPGDLRSMRLPEGQYDLIRALRKSSKRIILVYFGGRPRLLGDMVELVDAIFVGFLPGPDAGRALADLIAGDVNPSGKLPITYPQFDDGGGVPYFHAVSDQCTVGSGTLPHYGYVPCQVQWPFGHGLSYTTFEYTNLQVSSTKLQYKAVGQDRPNLKDEDKTLTVTVDVMNTGSFAGSEIVLFFTFDESRHVTPEHKRLRYFDKIYLKPGEFQTVTATISADDSNFQSIGPHDDSHPVLQNGMTFQVGVGANVDCRTNGNSENLCSDPITIDTGDDYIAACDWACRLWTKESQCGAQFFNDSPQKCWNMCKTSSGIGDESKGWGWNYVNCIESVISDMNRDEDFTPEKCWKMTSHCRNVFMVDPLSAGAPSLPSPSSPSPIATGAAVLAGIMGTVSILLSFRGKIPNSGVVRREEAEDSDDLAELVMVDRLT